MKYFMSCCIIFFCINVSFAQTNLSDSLKINLSEEIPYRYLRAEIMKFDLHFLGLEKKAAFHNPYEKSSFICYAIGITIISETESYKMGTRHLILMLFGF